MLDGNQLGKNGPAGARQRQSAVEVTGPLYWKFFYMVTLFLRPQDDFHVKHETVTDTLAIQLLRHIPSIHLETAL